MQQVLSIHKKSLEAKDWYEMFMSRIKLHDQDLTALQPKIIPHRTHAEPKIIFSNNMLHKDNTEELMLNEVMKKIQLLKLML